MIQCRCRNSYRPILNKILKKKNWSFLATLNHSIFLQQLKFSKCIVYKLPILSFLNCLIIFTIKLKLTRFYIIYHKSFIINHSLCCLFLFLSQLNNAWGGQTRQGRNFVKLGTVVLCCDSKQLGLFVGGLEHQLGNSFHARNQRFFCVVAVVSNCGILKRE